ncbi:MAG: BolA/IbaG family iron-sulfur metabolism protein [Bacteriovoracia bacterium]
MTPEQLKKRLEALATDAQVSVIDQTGTQDHYEVRIVSSAFEGKLPLEQKKMVQGLVKPELLSGELHALTITALTPAQAKGSPHG